MDLNSDTVWDLAQMLLGPGGGVLGFVLAARGKFADVLTALEGIQKTLAEMRTTDALLAQRVTVAEAEILELRRKQHDMTNILTGLKLAEDRVGRRTQSGEIPKVVE
jgi:hypothetical protein